MQKKRVELFRSNQKKYSSAQNNLALKRVNTTRWSSHSAALNTVLTSHNAVIEPLATIKLSGGPGDAKTGAAASGLLDYFTSYRFLIVAIMFKKLFQIIEPANKILQTRDLDLLAATNLIESAKHKIKLLNDRSLNAFQDIIKKVDQFVIDSEQEFTPIVVSRQKRCPKKSGELSKDTPILDLVKQIRIECFNKTLDIIQIDFSERFNINETGLMKDLSLISRRRIMEVRKNPETLPKDAFIIVCKIYSKYLNRESLISEYQQFSSNFIELEKSIKLPLFLHETDDHSDCDDDDVLKLGLDMDLYSIKMQIILHNLHFHKKTQEAGVFVLYILFGKSTENISYSLCFTTFGNYIAGFKL